MSFRVRARESRSQTASSKLSKGWLFSTGTLQFPPDNRGMREREAVKDANGDPLSLRGASSVLVADGTLSSVSQAAAARRAALCERNCLCKISEHLLPQTTRLTARDLWGVGNGSDLINRYAKEVENEEA